MDLSPLVIEVITSSKYPTCHLDQHRGQKDRQTTEKGQSTIDSRSQREDLTSE